MWYILVFLLFFVTLFCLVFAKDSYINQELLAYQRTLNEPWMHRVIALKYASSNS